MPQPYTTAAHRALIAQTTHLLVAGHEHLHCASACAGYHRGWMLLQHLGLISGLASERVFIVDAIRSLAAQRPMARVLIAGCADFGLLSVLHEALGAAIGTIDVTVRDRCETPLWLCRAYAAQMGFEALCQQQDLLAEAPPGRFDLVLTHSLLSFCPPAERGALMARLAGQLTPGGTLLVYQSIRPAALPQVLAYGAAEVDTMVERALTAGAAHIGAAQWPPAQMTTQMATQMATQLAELVRAFCAAKTTVSVPSAASVVAAAEAEGLVLRGSRLLFDSASSPHRAATPASHHLKYEFSIGAATWTSATNPS
jgi:SAM-dependent methyltransferase